MRAKLHRRTFASPHVFTTFFASRLCLVVSRKHAREVSRCLCTHQLTHRHARLPASMRLQCNQLAPVHRSISRHFSAHEDTRRRQKHECADALPSSAGNRQLAPATHDDQRRGITEASGRSVGGGACCSVLVRLAVCRKERLSSVSSCRNVARVARFKTRRGSRRSASQYTARLRLCVCLCVCECEYNGIRVRLKHNGKHVRVI